jgi:cell wall-associated NlpC family hydrolase
MGDEAQERARVVAVAKSYLRTPYHHMGRKRGVGVDCATLVLACFVESGLIQDTTLGYYAMQWNLHQADERYLAVIKQHAREIDAPPGPGDIVVWQMGHTMSHGAIVVDWPRIIHARYPTGCEYADAEADQILAMLGNKPRPRQTFSYWAPRA